MSKSDTMAELKMNKVTIKFGLLVLIVFLQGCVDPQTPMPLARKGVIDFSTIDICHHEPVSLDGQWAFYWSQFLTPADFHSPNQPVVTAYLALPGAWNGTKVDAKKLGGEGYATFRLRILHGSLEGDLSLYLGPIASAYRLWVNGKLLIENGRVGKELSEESPAQSVQLPRLPVDGKSLDLVMQVSNFHYHKGGVVSSIKLGASDRLETAQALKWGLALFCIGSLLVMGLYHLVLFGFYRKNDAPLYFGFYCLLWTGYLLTCSSNDWVINLLIKKIPVPLLNRIDFLCFVISVPILCIFLRTLYPHEFSRRLHQAAGAMAAVYTFIGLALPTLTFTSVIPGYYLFCIIVIFSILFRLFVAVRKKREGSLFIFLGFIALGFAGLNDMLLDMQLIPSVYLIHLGMSVFVLFQAIALSLRFSRAFTVVERLSDVLAGKNLSLEKEMAERTRLEREIVNVIEEERRRISHDLHDGLCQLLTGARLQFSALRMKLAGTGEQLSEWRHFSSLLEESVNIAYDLSRGLWPVEHDPRKITLSLEDLVQRLSESSGIAIEFRQHRGCGTCTNSVVTQLFRIAQEAITNAVKHAEPDRIIVGMDCADQKTITLTVEDNGIGCSNDFQTQGGLGIRMMFHRARIIGGTLTVSEREGGGTVVVCIVPCERESMEASQ